MGNEYFFKKKRKTQQRENEHFLKDDSRAF